MDVIETLIRFWPKLLDGAMMTIWLVFASTLIGAVIALPAAIAKTSGNRFLSTPVQIYISFFRGTPMLAQLFLVYYGSGQFREELMNANLWWFFREPINCAILTFALNTGAYQTESLRGGLMGVVAGEVEAARAIGMSWLTMHRRIILPHAYRIAFPALGNEVILMIKASSIASTVTIFDIMNYTSEDYTQNFDFLVYLLAGMAYLAMTTAFVNLWRWLERKLNPQWTVLARHGG
jgi:polar amino acid transport system permease protein